ncbi:hypothetical protein ACEUCJ_15130 [Aeromonas rivipollensis]|uniref:hypothetical protein n=1 Tax=Aeromonas rivipollensis TaxID=948519 RepID=UPI0038D09A6D
MKAVITNPTGFEITVQGALYPVACIKRGQQEIPVKSQEHFDWLKGQLLRLLKNAPHLTVELVELAPEPEPEPAPTSEPESEPAPAPAPVQTKGKGKSKQNAE